MLKFVDGEIKLVDEPALTALNMRLRDDYTRDCAKGIERFNKIIERIGVDFRLALPHVAFHRDIGEFKDVQATPAGVLIDAATWAKEKDKWLPSVADGDFIASLMKPVSEPGQFASWIAPPKVGIDNRPGRLRVRQDRGVSSGMSAPEQPTARNSVGSKREMIEAVTMWSWKLLLGSLD